MKLIIWIALLSLQASLAAELSVMSYNVENLFDTEDDPKYYDEDFLPDGRYNWTVDKLDWKLRNLSKVITSIENPDGSKCPDVLGLTEVENRYILEVWAHYYMPECGYKRFVIHEQEPNEPVIDDVRGIKVALMSKYPLAAQPVTYTVYKGGRFILEVSIRAHGKLITFFVNHWKSRLGGGEEKRILAAETLKERLRQLNEYDPMIDLIVLGDFNDEPENQSLDSVLQLSDFPSDMFNDLREVNLWNASFEKFHLPSLLHHAQYMISQGSAYTIQEIEKEIRKRRATYYYQKNKEFLQLDHIMMSRGLFDNQGFRYKENSFKVVNYLKEFTAENGAPIPFRPSKNGAIGGASDHFPVLVRLEVNP